MEVFRKNDIIISDIIKMYNKKECFFLYILIFNKILFLYRKTINFLIKQIKSHKYFSALINVINFKEICIVDYEEFNICFVYGNIQTYNKFISVINDIKFNDFRLKLFDNNGDYNQQIFITNIACVFIIKKICIDNSNLLYVEFLKDVTNYLSCEAIDNVSIYQSVILHDIKNFLMGIIGFANFILRLDDISNIKDLANNILIAANKIIEIIKRTFFISYEKSLIFKEFNLKEEIEKCIKIADPINQYKISFNVLCVDTSIYADQYNISSAILNLIKNSIESLRHTDDSIKIDLQSDEKHFYISVLDTGSGIPCEILSRIGTPFFTTKNTGSGLGLFQIKKIIEAHHGTLMILTNLHGTQIKISLPKIKGLN